MASVYTQSQITANVIKFSNDPAQSALLLLETPLPPAQTCRDYHLSVALPESYATSNQESYATSNQTYPVIYLLDGNLFLGMAAGLTPISRLCLGTPEVIIVGIGYYMESYAQLVHLRERDFKIPEVRDAQAVVSVHLKQRFAICFQAVLPPMDWIA